jgi:protein SCO1
MTMLRHLLLQSGLAAIGVVLSVVLALRASASDAGNAASERSERSIYLLDSVWTDDTGKRVILGDLSGHYQVLAFIFTSCGGACPTLVKSMQRNLRSLPADIRQRTKLLLVSIDPEHDTPRVLHEYRQQMGLAADRWSLLQGSSASVRELAAVVGFNYDRGENGTFAHSNFVTLLDPDGEVVLQHPGSSSSWEAIADKIGMLEAARSPSRATAIEQ